MVLIVVSVASLVGITYMTASTLKAASTVNLVQATRAKYLAESALEHGMSLLHTDAARMVGSSPDAPLGPFYLDDSDDSYVIWARNTGDVGVWMVTGQGCVGESVQAVSARVFIGPGPDVAGGQTAFGSGMPVTIPESVKIFGNVTILGTLVNNGTVTGDIVHAGGEIVTGRHDGGVRATPAQEIMIPRIGCADYVDYCVAGVRYAAVRVNGTLGSSNTLTKGQASTPSNPAGVVVIDPDRSGESRIGANVEFVGTIVAHGNLVIDGSHITLTAAKGFPAIVCEGAVYVSNSTKLTVNGLVVAAEGIRPYTNNTSASSTIIHGPLITKNRLYDDKLLGSHELRHHADAGRLYDVKAGVAASGPIRILDWYDH